MRVTAVGLLLSSLALAQSNTSLKAPRHLFKDTGFLTEAAAGAPRAIADGFLQRSAARFGVSEQAMSSARVIKEYKTAHNGVTHLVYRQQFQGIDVYNSEWTVNIDATGQVINSGGQIVEQPAAGLKAADLAQAQCAAARRGGRVSLAAPVRRAPAQ